MWDFPEQHWNDKGGEGAHCGTALQWQCKERIRTDLFYLKWWDISVGENYKNKTKTPRMS